MKGYTETFGQLDAALARLQTYIEQLPQQLQALSEAELTAQPPGKWSKKQILGHLIDSAINNLKRFTDAQLDPSPYVVQRYNQSQLVVINRYQELPLAHLLALWQALNQQIWHVGTAMPDAVRQRPVQAQYDEEIVTLSWILEDYVAHLEHHLRQLA